MAITTLQPFNLDTTANYTFANITTTTANLGAVGNVKITGGTANYVLSTDGAGNLSWSAQTGGLSANVFFENSLVVSANYTITSGKSAMSTGPITINSGVVVTVPDGSKWVVL